MTGGPIVVPAGYVVDRWRVGELIGSGAWGSVYAADETSGGGEPPDTDTKTGVDVGREPLPQVALKFLPTAYLTPGQRALLDEVVDREARFSLRADHPHLIRTFAVHTLRQPDRPDLDGAVVIVMERAAANLRDLLANDGPTSPTTLTLTPSGATRDPRLDEDDDQASTTEPPAPLSAATQLLIEICDALAHMHAQGWVHGDLKPGNILIMEDGSARIADFGVTAQIEGTHAYAPRIGSSDYLPPEWWTERVGEKGIPLRKTADIWAFGVIAHQVLTGGLHPFPGAAQQSRAMAVQSYANGTAQLRLDPSIGPGWRRIIEDCLAPDHESRSAYDAAGILARIRALSEAGDDQAAGLRREKGARRRGARRWSRRRTVVAGSALVAVSAAAAAGGWWAAESPGASAPASSVRQIYLTGDLKQNAAVPAQYRDMITRAARLCQFPDVTPALIAAILKVESNFNPAFSDPATQSYGIAGWTPEVFRSWAHGVSPDYMKPADAIPAVSNYLCWLEEGYRQAGVSGDDNLLLAAGYNSSRKSVIEANGVPANSEGFANEVAQYANQYGD